MNNGKVFVLLELIFERNSKVIGVYTSVDKARKEAEKLESLICGWLQNKERECIPTYENTDANNIRFFEIVVVPIE